MSRDDIERPVLGIIPGKSVQIEWNDDDQRRMTELVVFDRSSASPEEMDRFGRRFISSHGACVAGWMDGRRARSTPEGQFIDWALDGFADEWTMLEALTQLGRIEEAGWARTMAEALRETLRQRSGEGWEDDERLITPEYVRS